MNKFIYKQTNKIVLVLLALGCMVSNVGVVYSAPSSSSGYPAEVTQERHNRITGCNAQPGIATNSSQIPASDKGHSPSLPGSSGDRPTAERTLAAISEQKQGCTVRTLGGEVLETFPGPITYQQLYSKVENLIPQRKGCYSKCQLINAGGTMGKHDDTSEARGEITCVSQPCAFILKTREDTDSNSETLFHTAGWGYLHPIYKDAVDRLAKALGVPDLEKILHFLSQPENYDFLSSLDRFKEENYNLNGFPHGFFYDLLNQIIDSKVVMLVAKVDDMPPEPTSEDRCRASAECKPKAIEALKLMLKAYYNRGDDMKDCHTSEIPLPDLIDTLNNLQYRSSYGHIPFVGFNGILTGLDKETTYRVVIHLYISTTGTFVILDINDSIHLISHRKYSKHTLTRSIEIDNLNSSYTLIH